MWMIMMIIACNGKSNDSASECGFDGDLDGLGTDTGDLPSLYGAWTTTFGSRSYYDECEIEGLSRNSFDWINGGAMQIGGRIDDVSATLASAPEADLHVVMSDQGGVTIAGTYEFRGYELNIAIGGLLFENVQLGINEIEGHGYMGIDTNGDGSIDCGIMGDFNAKSSG